MYANIWTDFKNKNVFATSGNFTVTSMLMTDVGDEMCWLQLYDVCDNFDLYGNQDPIYYSFGPKHSNDVTSIEIKEYVWTSRYFFFAKDVAPRWASNHRQLHENYRDKY